MSYLSNLLDLNEKSLLFAISIFTIAYITAFILKKKIGFSAGAGRMATVDGLRGFLALFVYIHHASIWRTFIINGQWGPADNRLYVHFGETSVAYFFLITSFLFTNKILALEGRAMSFRKLFVGRLYRIVPLYYFAILLVVFIIFLSTNFRLNEPIINIFAEIGGWLTFSIYGRPNINGFSNSSIIIAGVIWSLRYEWYFYFFLPVLYAVITRKIPSIFAFVPLVIMIGINIIRPENYEFQYYYPFIGGIFASFAVKNQYFFKFDINSYKV